VSAAVTCPAGKILVGGGAQVEPGTGASSSDDAVIVATFPSGAPPDTFHATAKATSTWASGHHILVTAYAICSS